MAKNNSTVLAKKPTVGRLRQVATKVTGRSQGTISIRHRGGGSRSHYRLVDFDLREKAGIPGTITALEYDPRRTAYIALVTFADGDKRYVLAHQGAKTGDKIITDIKARPQAGNRMHIENIPVGFDVFNVEITPNKGGQAVRSAGQSSKVISTEDERYAQIQMPSGEIRLVLKTNFATIGRVSNEDHNQEVIGKAGRVRHRGRRPQVRGKVMNPCDHPHGGGEAANSIGMAYPKTPWGAHALGVKTRRRKSPSNRLILQSRHRSKKR